MSRSKLKHSIATVAVGVLAASGLITYNGHAGLGASVYHHNQTELEFARVAAITDGTSNTVMFGVRAAAPADLGPGTDAPGP
jgi:hypothetical protein